MVRRVLQMLRETLPAPVVPTVSPVPVVTPVPSRLVARANSMYDALALDSNELYATPRERTPEPAIVSKDIRPTPGRRSGGRLADRPAAAPWPPP